MILYKVLINLNTNMNKCPMCRISLNNSYSVKCISLKEYVENADKCYELINFYSRNYSIECPICFEKLSEPRVLSCGHTICSKCNNKIDWKNIGLFNQYHKQMIENKALNISNSNLYEAIIKLNKENNILKTKVEHLIAQNASFKEMMRVTPRYIERTKICRFWANNMCKFTHDKCKNAHGQSMLNTFFIW
tara:strand:+ start:142 stop:714 length:573 start_codon:yes stop_codon:yes gene_type:complete